VRSEQVCRSSGAEIAGPHAKSVVIDTRAQRWLAAVEFGHGGVSRFFSMLVAEVPTKYCDSNIRRCPVRLRARQDHELSRRL
jgi:hypothetical protein